MKATAVKFALFPLIGLSALALKPCACAQGTVRFAPSPSYLIEYSPAPGEYAPIPVGNPAQVGAYGNLNVQVYYAPVGTPPPFTADGASLIPAPWTPSSSSPLQQIVPLAGVLFGYNLTLAEATSGASEEVLVVGWTGPYANWNSAYTASSANPSGVLLAWTGSGASGGALAWVNGTGNPNAIPPTVPVPLTTGPAGYNGLVFESIPEPSLFALAGVGTAMLIILRRCR
jgi:hypothetical protein